MKRVPLLIIVIAVPLIGCIGLRTSYSEEPHPLTSSPLAEGGKAERQGVGFSEKPNVRADMKNISETIKGKYSHNVYLVNAWSRITSDANGNKMKDKTIRWRRKIGTAFTLRECGYLITPLCVVTNAERISVILRSGGEIDAQIVGSDTRWAIAVLKINDPEMLVLPPIAPRNSIGEGNDVVFLGIMQGTMLTTRAGTISKILPGDGTLVVSVSGEPGITGTPVFNTGGQLLGILTYHLINENLPENNIKQGEEVYLVIPMDYTMIVAQSIINSTEKNKGWLGVRINLVNFNNDTNGVVIQNIIDDSPASRCGLKALDRIVEFNGSPIKTVHEMLEAASGTCIGETVTIKVFRDNKMLTFNVALAEPPQTR